MNELLTNWRFKARDECIQRVTCLSTTEHVDFLCSGEDDTNCVACDVSPGRDLNKSLSFIDKCNHLDTEDIVILQNVKFKPLKLPLKMLTLVLIKLKQYP